MKIIGLKSSKNFLFECVERRFQKEGVVGRLNALSDAMADNISSSNVVNKLVRNI